MQVIEKILLKGRDWTEHLLPDWNSIRIRQKVHIVKWAASCDKSFKKLFQKWKFFCFNFRYSLITLSRSILILSLVASDISSDFFFFAATFEDASFWKRQPTYHYYNYSNCNFNNGMKLSLKVWASNKLFEYGLKFECFQNWFFWLNELRGGNQKWIWNSNDWHLPKVNSIARNIAQLLEVEWDFTFFSLSRRSNFNDEPGLRASVLRVTPRGSFNDGGWWATSLKAENIFQFFKIRRIYIHFLVIQMTVCRA